MPTRIVVLDTGPLGIATHPRAHPDMTEWLETILEAGRRVVIPEIADYELRRELIRIAAGKSIARLDALENSLDYLPITSEAMRKAAKFWADARRAGKPTAPDPALDGDMILAAQTATAFGTDEDVVVATDNVGHLCQFVHARRWDEIA